MSSSCFVSQGNISQYDTLETSLLLNVMVFYREKIRHSKFAWNDNGTLTYKSQRNAVFDPELNNLSLNDTVIVPNIALLVSNFGTRNGRSV